MRCGQIEMRHWPGTVMTEREGNGGAGRTVGEKLTMASPVPWSRLAPSWCSLVLRTWTSNWTDSEIPVRLAEGAGVNCSEQHYSLASFVTAGQVRAMQRRCHHHQHQYGRTNKATRHATPFEIRISPAMHLRANRLRHVRLFSQPACTLATDSSHQDIDHRHASNPTGFAAVGRPCYARFPRHGKLCPTWSTGFSVGALQH